LQLTIVLPPTHTHTAKRAFQDLERMYVTGSEGEVYGQCL